MLLPENTTAFQNRLLKMAKHFDKWARRQQLEAYRIYDADLDEFPITIDRYGCQLYVAIYAPKGIELDDDTWHQVRNTYREIIMETLRVDRNDLFFKLRKKAKGGEQYDKLAWVERASTITENGLRFRLNLTDYLDTGLFLDHRQTRALVGALAKGKSMLNLFAYTCSFSVYAAAAGGRTHSIDLSNTYLEWGKRNFEANDLDPEQHRFERADVLAWLATPNEEKYDLIVLDPPTFSNSKAMSGVLDTQRDHALLIQQALRRLAAGGSLFFSTNYRRFVLDEAAFDTALWQPKEITKQTVPPDFRKRLPHRCWQFRQPLIAGGSAS